MTDATDAPQATTEMGEKRLIQDGVTVKKRKIFKGQDLDQSNNANTIFVNKHTLLHPTLKRVRRMFISQVKSDSEKGKPTTEGRKRTVALRGMGAAISRTCMLGLQICEMLEMGAKMRIDTDTVEIIDDLLPDDVDTDWRTQQRKNSAITITIIV